MITNKRLVLVDPDGETRPIIAKRLRAQGFVVDEAVDGVTGAEMALSAPPAAVVSDLWMAGVSGVQLSRLLGAEPATADVPVVLRADNDDARSRFWARRAGARALVKKGSMGELVRTLADVTAKSREEDGFFLGLPDGAHGVRDRIAEHLDRALFESVVAADVRALASASAFDRLFDGLSQLLIQLMDYRWLALTTVSPAHFAVHARREHAAASELEARRALSVSDAMPAVHVLDDDAHADPRTERTTVHDVSLGGVSVARLAVGLPAGAAEVDRIMPLVTQELGAVLRLVLLLEESLKLATTDSLTGLFNRRAFVETTRRELARAARSGSPCSFLLLDLDFFKKINDTHGHGAGDTVLAAVGSLLRSSARLEDTVARWGGEEFVIGATEANAEGAATMAERIRTAVELLVIPDARGGRIPLSVSIGVAEVVPGESLEAVIDRADRAMYAAKVGGRNQVRVASNGVAPSAEETADDAPESAAA